MNKIIIATALVLSLILFSACDKQKPSSEEIKNPSVKEEINVEPEQPEQPVEPEQPEVPEQTEQAQTKPLSKYEVKGWRPSPFDYGYKVSESMEDNLFWDSLIYTGYNMQEHYNDGMMWEYVLAEFKREMGWLSDIGYAGGSLGYETTADGKPDINHFEKGGLVCASYVTYVYFNYLPNVAGIDTSMLTKPVESYKAHDWYEACLKWVEDGYSRQIGFTATNVGGFIKLEPDEEIPIGSILAFHEFQGNEEHCSHVCVYAGYQNGYHWVYHVGNDNGPEFCAVERMTFGPGPQWPLAIFTTPEFIE